MIPYVEPLKSDPGDGRLKFRLGETLSKATCITAEDEDVEPALLLERSIFEGLYSRFCYRCGTICQERARFCPVCGEKIERNEENPEFRERARPRVVMEMKEDTEMKEETEMKKEAANETGGSQ